MFVHLNTHSVFSKMSGTATVQEIVAAAKKERFSHLALTEVNGMYGFIHFVQYAKDAGILPIAGANIITPRSDIILLAENQKGYENLCRLVSKVHHEPEIAANDLFSVHRDGLFVLAHLESDLAELVHLFPVSHLFVELRPGVEEHEARSLAEKFGLEIVATGDVYFLKKEDHRSHKILRAIANNTTLSHLSESDYKNPFRIFLKFNYPHC